MKKIAILFSILLLVKCTPIPKFELPTKGKPAMVIYTRDIPIVEDKMINYEKLMAKFRELSPDAKLILDDKSNCYFQMTGYSPYTYKGKLHKFSYLLSFQGEADKCSLMINRIKILHYDIEHMYRDNKRKTTKHFNPCYEEINTKINSVLDELVKQLK